MRLNRQCKPETKYWQYSLRSLFKQVFVVAIAFGVCASLGYLGVLLCLLGVVLAIAVKAIRRRRVGWVIAMAVLAFVDLAAIGPELVMWWNGLGFARTARAALRREVAYVEFQPNTDWPRYQIHDEAHIDRFKNWLFETQEYNPVRSAPPRMSCELKIVYANGDRETIPISPFRPPKGRAALGVRTTVEIYWRGHGRTGQASALADILSLDAARELPED